MHGKEPAPADVQALLAYIRQHRANGDPFEVVQVGSDYEHGKEAGEAMLAEYAEAGVT